MPNSVVTDCPEGCSLFLPRTRKVPLISMTEQGLILGNLDANVYVGIRSPETHLRKVTAHSHAVWFVCLFFFYIDSEPYGPHCCFYEILQTRPKKLDL